MGSASVGTERGPRSASRLNAMTVSCALGCTVISTSGSAARSAVSSSGVPEVMMWASHPWATAMRLANRTLPPIRRSGSPSTTSQHTDPMAT